MSIPWTDPQKPNHSSNRTQRICWKHPGTGHLRIPQRSWVHASASSSCVQSQVLKCYIATRNSVLLSSAVLLLLWLISVTLTWCGNNRKYTVSHPVFYSELVTTCVDISDLKQIMKLVGLVMLLYKAELYCSAWGYTEISSASDFDIKIYY